MRLRNADALKNYVDSMKRPKSLNANHYLTKSQVATAYAPLASSEQSIIDYLQSYGFHVTLTMSQHLVVGVQGTVSDPMVPSSLAGLIQNVSGLDNAVTFTHPPITKHSLSGQSTPNTQSSNAVTCLNAQHPLLPSEVATAYNCNGFYSAGFKGEGQTIALVEFDDYNLSDIKAYTGCYGGGSVPINKHLVDGGTGSGPSRGAFEVEMDMELILGMAPHLAGLNVYEAPNTEQGSNDMWAQIINNDAVPVISTSWSICEVDASNADLNFENGLFILAAAQGQTIFAASGDAGINACDPSSPNYGTISVNDPASQPYVTGVGGTTLTLTANNDYSSETVWHNDPQDATGGGLSSIWSQPSWQQGPGVNNSYSNGHREVPDVALNADWQYSGYLVYCTVAVSCPGSYPWWYGGGTSASAPLWAAMMALTNQKSLHDGGFNVGFINPLLYQTANGTSYSNDFHDVTTGNNDTIDSTGKYPATPNYDMTTGLGSFNAWNLGQDLAKLAVSQNPRSTPAATKWYFAEGSVGGSFQEYLTILNSSAQNATVQVQYLRIRQPGRCLTRSRPAVATRSTSMRTWVSRPAQRSRRSRLLLPPMFRWWPNARCTLTGRALCPAAPMCWERPTRPT
ncbi:S53 family peptidase [Ktedonobacter racemifer]|uniref:S53 family peptidase n=1 Tax=Ktedonobacter racemifer TaxID=363277 RepID=UPI001FCAC1AA|nr:S53 family peptidase [Ktedonobacter racemifer]